jgi:hypothetical protein
VCSNKRNKSKGSVVLIAVSSKYSDRRGGGSEVKFNCLLKFCFSKRTMKMHVQNQSKTNCVAQQTTTSNNEIYCTPNMATRARGMAWLTFFTHRSNLNRDKSNDKKTYG